MLPLDDEQHRPRRLLLPGPDRDDLDDALFLEQSRRLDDRRLRQVERVHEYEIHLLCHCLTPSVWCVVNSGNLHACTSSACARIRPGTRCRYGTYRPRDAQYPTPGLLTCGPAP